jgi:hypothetical protein
VRRGLPPEIEPLAAVAILRPLGARPTSYALSYETRRWHARWEIDWVPPKDEEEMDAMMRRAEKRGYVERQRRGDGRAGWVATDWGKRELAYHQIDHPHLVRQAATAAPR